MKANEFAGCRARHPRLPAVSAGLAVTLGAMLTSSANAQLHGGGVQKACDQNLCVGNNLRCIIAARYLDDFLDVLMVSDAFDVIQATGGNEQFPVTIFAVVGNAVCAGAGNDQFPCFIGPPGTTDFGLPGSAQTGQVLFLSDDYIIQADDPDPLFDTATVVFEDQCDQQPVGCNPDPQPLPFGASTNIIHPAISIDKNGTPVGGALCVGSLGTIDYTYAVSNTGDVPLSNIDVSDPDCTPEAVLQADAIHNIGDVNDNDLLDLTETWQFVCSRDITPLNTDPIDNTATATGDAPQSTGTSNLPPEDTCSVEDSDTATVTPTNCPVCKDITPVVPPTGNPQCDTGGNQLTADVNNDTPDTTFDWNVTGPCVITAGEDTLTVTYSTTAECALDNCCEFTFTVDDPNDNAPPSICEETVCCDCEGGGEGRTPGFWKQPHHFGHWCDEFCPSDSCCPKDEVTLFCEVFDCAGAGASCADAVDAAYGDKTLLEVLSQGGGGFKALGRHAVAGLLNACVDDEILDYFLDVQGVIDLVDEAIANCDPGPAHHELAENNELEGGDLGGQSFCTDLNLDGEVNNTDLGILVSNWGKPGRGDIDNNGVVGTNDLNILISNWGTY